MVSPHKIMRFKRFRFKSMHYSNSHERNRINTWSVVRIMFRNMCIILNDFSYVSFYRNSVSVNAIFTFQNFNLNWFESSFIICINRPLINILVSIAKVKYLQIGVALVNLNLKKKKCSSPIFVGHKFIYSQQIDC